MRRFQLLFTSACLFTFGACVASVDDEPPEALAEVGATEAVGEVESAIEAQPICPDQVFRLRYSEECTTPRGDGLRECTDTITMHRSPVFKVGGFECKTTDTTVTTSCGFCVVIDLPDDGPGDDELPF